MAGLKIAMSNALVRGPLRPSPPAEMVTNIAENIARVEERVAAACARSGRRREEVRLVAVSKTHPVDLIRAAFEAGLCDFGENRVQEANSKHAPLADLAVTWHLVGHLQSNKARVARELFQWVHSLDSGRLAEKLAAAARPGEPRMPVLIEVNLGEETSKSGLGAGDAATLAEQVAALASLDLRGLMVVPPFMENPEDVRPYFRRLRGLAEEIGARHLPNVSMRELSMGMSHDFEVAIEEGATIVRVGTAIFGARQ
ncbi:MAG TPA: YggS family pyridoxal phosphate-dependent enzyme [Terriglobia bacterium]|nr:YggS family pyridoxal phosphate-dependent enzyme [Terriglobia bacterium]